MPHMTLQAQRAVIERLSGQAEARPRRATFADLERIAGVAVRLVPKKEPK